MPVELPIVRALSQTELPARLHTLAELGPDALLEARREGGHAVMLAAFGPPSVCLP